MYDMYEKFENILRIMQDRWFMAKRAQDEEEPYSAIGNYIAYGRTLSEFADYIGDLCNFGEPAKFVEGDLYEFWVDDDDNFGLINLSKAHREALDRERNYNAFMTFINDYTEVAE